MELPYLSSAEFAHSWYKYAAKRVLDILISFIALVLLAPVLVLIALLTRLDSPGPVLFGQRRVGRHGKVFTCFKFRTMRHNCDQAVHQQAFQRMANGGTMSDDPTVPFKLAGDSRITRVGLLLRRTSLDELPQLINVLRGDMSLVGPRPAIPYELENYTDWHHDRHLVKPGITGLWQVYGRGKLGFMEGLRLDVQYATGWTLLLDLKLIAITVPVLLMQRSAR